MIYRNQQRFQPIFLYLIILIFQSKKKDEYIKRKISELSYNIIPKIYLEIVKIYFDKKSEKNKDFEEEKNIQDLNEEDQKEESINENINIDKDQTIKEKDNEDSNSSFEEGKKDIKECYSEDDENNIDCKDFKALIDYIFDRYIEKLEDENDINNIIKLIECLKGKFQSKEKKDAINKEILCFDNFIFFKLVYLLGFCFGDLFVMLQDFFME